MGSRKKLKSDVRAFAKLHQRDHHEEVRKLLRKGGHTIKEIAEAVNLTEALASAVVTDLQHSNTNIKTSGERISIAPHPEPASIEGQNSNLKRTLMDGFTLVLWQTATLEANSSALTASTPCTTSSPPRASKQSSTPGTGSKAKTTTKPRATNS